MLPTEQPKERKSNLTVFLCEIIQTSGLDIGAENSMTFCFFFFFFKTSSQIGSWITEAETNKLVAFSQMSNCQKVTCGTEAALCDIKGTYCGMKVAPSHRCLWHPDKNHWSLIKM